MHAHDGEVGVGRMRAEQALGELDVQHRAGRDRRRRSTRCAQLKCARARCSVSSVASSSATALRKLLERRRAVSTARARFGRATSRGARGYTDRPSRRRRERLRRPRRAPSELADVGEREAQVGAEADARADVLRRVLRSSRSAVARKARLPRCGTPLAAYDVAERDVDVRARDRRRRARTDRCLEVRDRRRCGRCGCRCGKPSATRARAATASSACSSASARIASISSVLDCAVEPQAQLDVGEPKLSRVARRPTSAPGLEVLGA